MTKGQEAKETMGEGIRKCFTSRSNAIDGIRHIEETLNEVRLSKYERDNLTLHIKNLKNEVWDISDELFELETIVEDIKDIKFR